ncbi:MAG: SpoIIE family protein phosphatase [Thermoleophilaceae bacterium]
MRQRAGDELRTRARQQAAVAAVGQRALADSDLDALLEDAAATVAQVLGVDRSDVLEAPPGDELVLRVSAGAAPGAAGRLRIPRVSGGLASYAIEQQQPVLSPDLAVEERFAAPILLEAGVASSLACPIGSRERPFGVLAAHSRSRREFTPDDANFVQAVANTVGAAVERGRADAAVLELVDVAPTLMWTTDADGHVTFVNRRWLEFTGRTLEEEVGDTWAMSAHPDDQPEMAARWRQALGRREEFQMEYRLRRADGEYRWVLEVGVPRHRAGEFVGHVGTATDIHERRAMEQSLRSVYEREHRIAEMLQRSLLPEKLPQLEGVGLAARYLPAGAETAIGGDWYDALELEDGRLALVVGDVVGHGLRAAAVMGQLRNAFRAYALVEGSPAETVARVDRLVAHEGAGAMATVLYLLLDRDSGAVSFTSAGHPPPLVLTADGPRFLEGGRSVPVGATDAGVFREHTEVIPPGSTLLLYTDGLVERRDVPLEQRLAELAAAATRSEGDLERLCDDVLAATLGGADPADDVALLVVRREPVGTRPLTLSLPAEPEALAGLRRRLGRFLLAAGASAQERYEITLTISEAAGNAIEHAYGPGDARFEVEAALDGGVVVVAVRDSGRWRDRRDEHRGRGLRIIEGLMDQVQVAREPGGTTVRMRRRLHR